MRDNIFKKNRRFLGICIAMMTVLAIFPVGEVSAIPGAFQHETYYSFNGLSDPLEKVIDVTTGDIHSNDGLEVIAVGSEDLTGIGELTVLQYNGGSLSQIAYTSWNNPPDPTVVTSVGVEDLDKSGSMEIVTGGSVGTNSELKVWRLDSANNLIPIDTKLWPQSGEPSHITDLAIDDIDCDGDIEIITTGCYIEGGVNLMGEINIFEFDGFQLVQKAGSPHRWYDLSSIGGQSGNSEPYAIDIFQTDFDGITGFEIATVGTLYDDLGLSWGQLVVWDYDGLSSPVPLNVREWLWEYAHDTRAIDVVIGEIDGVGGTEVVTIAQECFPFQSTFVSVWDPMDTTFPAVAKDDFLVRDIDSDQHNRANYFSNAHIDLEDIDIDSHPEIIVSVTTEDFDHPNLSGHEIIQILTWDHVNNQIIIDSPTPSNAQVKYQNGDKSFEFCITLADLESDGVKEIIVGGQEFVENAAGPADDEYWGIIDIWNWNWVDYTAMPLDSEEWTYPSEEPTEVYDVAIGDLSLYYGINHIVTAGWSGDMRDTYNGQLVHLQFEPSSHNLGIYQIIEFTPKPPYDHVQFNSVAIGNIDNDDYVEVITTGRTWGDYYGVGLMVIYEYYMGGGVWEIRPNNIDSHPPGWQGWYTTWPGSCKAVSIGDADNQLGLEVVTIGEFSGALDVRIWEWDDINGITPYLPWSSFTCTPAANWGTSIEIRDVDGDGFIEIVFAGVEYLGYGNYVSRLYVYSLIDPLMGPMKEANSRPDTNGIINDIAVGNIDSDGANPPYIEYLEIMAGGDSEISTWQWDRNPLNIIVEESSAMDNLDWRDAPEIRSITYGNVDSDPDIEIIAVGRVGQEDYFIWGQISVYNWDGNKGSDLTLESYEEWYTTRGTTCEGVAVGLFGADTNIVTGGTACDSVNPAIMRGQVRIWEKP